MKCILVGRHELLPIQRELLERVGIEIVKQVPQIPTDPQGFNNFIKELKEESDYCIVTTGLPLSLITQLVSRGVDVIVSKQEAVVTTEDPKVAEAVKNEKPHARFILKGRVGEKEMYRVMEFKGWYKIKRIVVEEEPLIELEKAVREFISS